MLFHTRPKNLKILCRNLHFSPIKNHTIENFTSEMNSHLTPKNGKIQYNSKAAYPEIKENPHDLINIGPMNSRI